MNVGAGVGEALTPQQLAVLRLYVKGHSQKQIAAILSLRVKTVQAHRTAIGDRLGLRTRAELMAWEEQHR